MNSASQADLEAAVREVKREARSQGLNEDEVLMVLRQAYAELVDERLTLRAVDDRMDKERKARLRGRVRL